MGGLRGVMPVSSKEFEKKIWEMVQPVEGKNGLQLPRPWFTAFDNPLKARVFVVGANQKNGYDPAKIDIERHFTGLFNRDGETCCKIYNEFPENQSDTRPRIKRLITEKLKKLGIEDVLETNIICRSSRQFSDLDADEEAAGLKIFSYLMETIRPKILIIYGKGVRKKFAKWRIGSPLGKWQELDKRLKDIFPNEDSEPTSILIDGAFEVFCIRGLARAGWSEWSTWAEAYTDRLADTVAHRLNS